MSLPSTLNPGRHSPAPPPGPPNRGPQPQALPDVTALFAGQSAFEELFDQQPNTVFAIKDLNGRYVGVNQALVARVGLKNKSELYGRTVWDIYPKALAAIFEAQDQLVMHSGKSFINHLELDWYSFRRPGWCLMTKIPLMDQERKIVGLVATSRVLLAPGEHVEIPPTLAEALNHLECHFDEPISPLNLSARCGIAPVRFARLIKRIFRVTPSQLINQVRLTEATRQLRDTDLNIAEIAQNCGFYDHSALTRAFRSVTGVTPSHMRGISKRMKS